MTDGFLTTGTVAQVLKISSERVRQLARMGCLCATRTTNGIRIFRAHDVEEFRKRREGRRAK